MNIIITIRTIKMKPVDIESGTYICYSVNHSITKPEFKIDDHVRIIKYTNISPKGYTSSYYLLLNRLRILLHGHMLLVIVMMKKLLKPFMMKSSQLVITCSNLTIETLEQGLKYVQS